MSENTMKRISLEKITLNMGAGEAGPKLDKSMLLLEQISKSKVVTTKTHKRTTFGPAKGRPIGAMVTLRGERARELLDRLLHAVDKKLKPGQFDKNGNFSFGVKEYIHIPGMKYDPDIGIMGIDVAVTLMRPGFRVARRRIRPGKVGKTHRITPEEAQKWVEENFQVKVTEEAEREYY
jgi:large subunit ribosomal protein L5